MLRSVSTNYNCTTTNIFLSANVRIVSFHLVNTILSYIFKSLFRIRSLLIKLVHQSLYTSVFALNLVKQSAPALGFLFISSKLKIPVQNINILFSFYSCKSHQLKQHEKIFLMPAILVISLKRWMNDEDKINIHVDFPITLQMGGAWTHGLDDHDVCLLIDHIFIFLIFLTLVLDSGARRICIWALCSYCTLWESEWRPSLCISQDKRGWLVPHGWCKRGLFSFPCTLPTIVS